MPDPISAAQAGLIRPHETADQHVARDLLSVKNERLRAENASLKSALRAAGRVIGPYINPPSGTPPRR